MALCYANGRKKSDSKRWNSSNCNHVLVWNQAELKAGKADLEEELVRPSACIGARHFVTFMLFLGMANAYIMRTNMSIAIVAMVNHTALARDDNIPLNLDECSLPGSNETVSKFTHKDGEFKWDSIDQNTVLSAFFWGYVVTQIPFGILSKKYGAVWFLGVGMLINSVFGLLVPMAAKHSKEALVATRFIQGLGEGPIVPCSHAILAKWIPPNERSRMGAFVYAGAQFGTVLSMPISGFLSDSVWSWPSIFYVFGVAGTMWSIWFLFTVYEDPDSHPRIPEDEKKYIVTSVWGSGGISEQNIPWKSIAKSSAFWAILIAHMVQNYGYETLLTQLPTFMRQVLHVDIKSNGIYSALPYLAMWLFSMVASVLADFMISSKRFSITTTRRIINSIGQYTPAIALVLASYTGCNPGLTVLLFTIGLGSNGAIYSGFKVNHLDISPRFAGVLMSFTNCLANLAGLIAPMVSGFLTHKKPTQAAWREVFFIAAVVYIVGATIYLVFASGVRQLWDDERLINQNRSRRKTQDVTAENGTNGVEKNNGMFGVANGTFDDMNRH